MSSASTVLTQPTNHQLALVSDIVIYSSLAADYADRAQQLDTDRAHNRAQSDHYESRVIAACVQLNDLQLNPAKRLTRAQFHEAVMHASTFPLDWPSENPMQYVDLFIINK